MKQINWKRSMVYILIFTIVIGMMGCSKEVSKKDEDGESKANNSNMGRYMEENIALPKEYEKGFSCFAINEKGEIELYTLTANEKGKMEAKKHILQKDKTFLSEDCVWLTESSLINSCAAFQIIYGQDGNLYASLSTYSIDNIEEGYKTVLLKASEDRKKAETISTPYLETKRKEGMFPNINKLWVLADGTFMADEALEEELVFFNSTKNKITGQLPAARSARLRHTFYVQGNQIVTANIDQSGLSIYQAESKEKDKNIDFKLKDSGYAFSLLENGDVYIADMDGIHKRTKDGTVWETIIDGSLNSLSLSNREVSDLIVKQGDQEEYYTYGDDGSGNLQLMHYYYDAKVMAVPEKEISIYSLGENATLRQAVVQFQKKNTNIRVNYQVAMGSEGGNISDYIKTLNTELLAGSGADILVLDGLPMNTYIEKGVLEDVSDLFKNANEKNPLLQNIVSAYQEDGKQYGMPIRIGVPILVGNQESLKAMQSLNLAAKYAESLGKDHLFNMISYQKLAEIFSAIEWNQLFDENQSIKEADLIQFLKNLDVISKNIKATEEGSEGNYSMINPNGMFVDLSAQIFLLSAYDNFFSSNNKVAMEYTTDLYSASTAISAKSQKKLEMSSFNGLFVPQGIISINKAGKNKDIAKEFYEYLFTEEIQDTILYDGYSVNANSLSKWMEMEEKNYLFSLSSDESKETFAGGWPEKEERLEFQKIIQSLNLPLESNRILKDSFIEGVVSFLKGDKSAEEAASSIKTKVDMYLAE